MTPHRMKPRTSFARKSLHAFAVVLPAALAFLPATTMASAAGGICSQIQGRLAAVTQAPRQDTSRLDRAVRQSRAAGCGSTGVASPHDTHCRSHAQRIDELRGSSQPAGHAGNDLRRERARLASALRVNGCVGQPANRTNQRQVMKRVLDTAPVLTVDGSIPVPTPRPASAAEIYQAGYVELGVSRQAALDLARIEELAQSRPIPLSAQGVRIVGGTFLAEPDSEMDFVAIATKSESPANELLVSLLAVLKGTLVSSAIAAER
jgi:hypothetical protein